MMIDAAIHIRAIEEIAMTALPALHTVYYDGWVLRFAGGHTRRANSVNPLYPSTLALDEKIAYCAGLYAAQGLPLVFKMTGAVSPPDLDTALAQQGFVASPPTSVQVMSLEGFAVDDLAPVTIETRRSSEWLEAYARMNEVPPQRRDLLGQMLDAIITPAFYAAVEQDGELAAVGLGVVAQGYIGLFDIVTAAQRRNQGLGTRIVTSLLRRGQAAGAHHAYLQVVADNTPAVSLYHKIGFREAYRYWYRNR